MPNTNISNLPNAQSVGWADAAITRLAANRIAAGGKEIHDISAISTSVALGWSGSTFGYSAAGVVTTPSMIVPLGTSGATFLRPTGGSAGTGLYWTSVTDLSLAISFVERFRFGSGGMFTATGGVAIGGSTGAPGCNFTGATGVATLGTGSGTSSGAAQEFIEMTAPSAPSANRVRFYAEDNGSGKTRLMALFNTGAAQQVAIEP